MIGKRNMRTGSVILRRKYEVLVQTSVPAPQIPPGIAVEGLIC